MTQHALDARAHILRQPLDGGIGSRPKLQVDRQTSSGWRCSSADWPE
jgi:hypothetical protein